MYYSVFPAYILNSEKFRKKGYCIHTVFSCDNFYVSFLLGFVNWNNKTFFRAMEKDAFEKWQPNIYNAIKQYYGDNSSDEEDEILSDIFPEVPPLPDFPDFAPTTSGNTYVSNQELKDLILTLTNFVTSRATTSNNNTTENTSVALTELPALTEKLSDCFNCVICSEKNFQSLSFCIHCRFIGCFECSIHVDRCPICRKKFKIKCTDCDEDIDLPRNAMMIPGLSAALITENERRNPYNETDT